MARMQEKPRRRWFQFKLSTVLILTAIAAWGMAIPPLVVTGYSGTLTHLDEVRSVNPTLGWPALALAAFLAWKAAWAVVERRRSKTFAQHESQSAVV
jgi:hypothetical protein